MQIFEDYIKRWSLIPDGEPIITPGSQLLPVLYQDKPAILKIPKDPEEGFGCRVMIWWSGGGR